MRVILLVCCLALTQSLLFAQSNQLVSSISLSQYLVERMPTFPGGSQALQAHLQSNLTYPDLALQYGVEGQVELNVQIDENGKIIAANIKKGLGLGCDKEALRLVSLLPNWQPGKINGTPIPTRMLMHINFRLQ